MPEMAAPRRHNARQSWTQEESELLKQLVAAGSPAKVIADRLGRSITAVMSKATKLGISIAEGGKARALKRDSKQRGDAEGAPE